MESSPVTFLPIGLAGFEKADDSVVGGGGVYNYGKVGVRNGCHRSENGIHSVLQNQSNSPFEKLNLSTHILRS